MLSCNPGRGCVFRDALSSPFIYHHFIITQSSLYHHPIITLSSPNHHFIITQSSLYHHPRPLSHRVSESPRVGCFGWSRNLKQLWSLSRIKCQTPKKTHKFICALYLGKTNFKYHFIELTILGCLAAIYILYIYIYIYICIYIYIYIHTYIYIRSYCENKLL